MKVKLAPTAATPEVVQEMRPVPPTAGTVGQVQPAGMVMDWKVVLAGTFCVYVAFAAVTPLLVTTSLKLTKPPDGTGSLRAVMVVPKSAVPAPTTVVEAL